MAKKCPKDIEELVCKRQDEAVEKDLTGKLEAIMEHYPCVRCVNKNAIRHLSSGYLGYWSSYSDEEGEEEVLNYKGLVIQRFKPRGRKIGSDYFGEYKVNDAYHCVFNGTKVKHTDAWGAPAYIDAYRPGDWEDLIEKAYVKAARIKKDKEVKERKKASEEVRRSARENFDV